MTFLDPSHLSPTEKDALIMALSAALALARERIMLLEARIEKLSHPVP